MRCIDAVVEHAWRFVGIFCLTCYAALYLSSAPMLCSGSERHTAASLKPVRPGVRYTDYLLDALKKRELFDHIRLSPLRFWCAPRGRQDLGFRVRVQRHGATTAPTRTSTLQPSNQAIQQD